MRCSIVNARKLHCRVVGVSMYHFHVVPAQARPKMLAGPCSPSCRNLEYGTALVFVSCRHSPKYFMLCCASWQGKKPCHGPPSNGTTQSPSSSFIRNHQLVHYTMQQLYFLDYNNCIFLIICPFEQCDEQGNSTPRFTNESEFLVLANHLEFLLKVC